MKIRNTGIDGKFAQYLKAVRADQGLSKSGLAKASGVNRTTICMIERDCGNPNVDNAWKLLMGLEKSFGDFELWLKEEPV